MLQDSLKHMNHYVVEKLADIEKLSKEYGYISHYNFSTVFVCLFP